MKLAAPLVALSLIAVACGSADADPTDTGTDVDTTGTGADATPADATPADVTSAGTAAAEPTPVPQALAATAGLERAAIDPAAEVSELTAGFNNAGFDLMRRLPADENTVFSPASIGHALLMAAAAGDDATTAAITDAFAFPDSAHAAWNNIDLAIAASQSERVAVTIADRIWPRLDVEPDQEWIDLLATQHGADVVPLDFGGDATGSRDVINGWVSDRTEALIPELLPEGFIEPSTLLVLTDAVYFEAEWANPFGKYGSVDAPFTTPDGNEVAASFMRELELSDLRGTGDGFVGAELPYAGNDYSMLVLVPDEGTHAEFVDRLDQTLLDEIDDTFTSGPYELLLPKWTDTSQIDLMDWLNEMGAAPGDYPAIDPGAFLGGAVHAADIAVDEFGTVAAAATAMGFGESGPPEPELTVAADQPFVYLIRHRASGLVLFAGQVTNPS